MEETSIKIILWSNNVWRNTVTYFSKEKSKEFRYIKYSDWQTVNGFLLPKTLTWYNYENNVPTTKQSDLQFNNIRLSTEQTNPQIFQMPEGAEVIE